MTRKDYQLIAYTLRDSEAPENVIEALAEAFAADNPRFDETRFILAALDKG
jgi:hypothetical protein